MAILDKHKVLETNATLLLVFSFLVVTIGGLVQIVPLFYLKNTIEKVEGMRPYTPLELAGRDIYVREGCYVCHSQMVRPMRDEVERYGHYSLAAESMYDHPFQWGSKRTGPDLARVGGKYSDDWQRRGIGTFLFNHLVKIARRNGIRGFTAEVLRNNNRMQAIFNHSGLKVTSAIEEGVYSFIMDF